MVSELEEEDESVETSDEDVIGPEVSQDES
jgi:hypothetical protein